MGKSKKLKKIRRLASQLPVIETMVTVKGDTLSGADLIKMGIKEVAGEPVVPTRLYVNRKMAPKALNHNRKMKDAYNKYGLKGAAIYANSVIQYTKQNDQHEHSVPQ